MSPWSLWNFKHKFVSLPVPWRGSITSYENLEKKYEIVPKKILSSVE